MRINGSGGGNAVVAGLAFERATSLSDALVAAGYGVVPKRKRSVRRNGVSVLTKTVENSLLFEGLEHHGDLVAGAKFYPWLEINFEVAWTECVARRLLPDDVFYDRKRKIVTIVEKKWQSRDGSVDEKLRGAGFLLRHYRALFAGTGVTVQVVYVLNDWFRQDRYRDDLAYMVECGVDYYFDELPLSVLGLG